MPTTIGVEASVSSSSSSSSCSIIDLCNSNSEEEEDDDNNNNRRPNIHKQKDKNIVDNNNSNKSNKRNNKSCRNDGRQESLNEDNDDDSVVIVGARRLANKRPKKVETTNDNDWKMLSASHNNNCKNDGIAHVASGGGDGAEQTKTTTSLNQQNQQLQSHQKKTADEQCLLILNTSPKERVGAVTETVLSALQHFALHSSSSSSSSLLLKPRQRQVFVSTAQHFSHIQQLDKWSCGYRNLQMLLSSLLPELPSSHPYFSGSENSIYNTIQSYYDIPSLRSLQVRLEQAWQQGWDPEGARHYQHKIVDQPKWIGAVENLTLLHALSLAAGVDNDEKNDNGNACIVQFVTCPASRQLLGRFCLEYFRCTRGGTDSATNPCSCFAKSMEQQTITMTTTTTKRSSTSITAVEYAKELLQKIGGGASRCPSTQQQQQRHEYPCNNSHVTSSRPCRCPCQHRPILPLYLQYQGHSLTILGVELADNNANSSEPLNLLVADPMKPGSHYVLSSSSQTAATTTTLRDGLQPFRRSCRTLQQNDSQIILVGPRGFSFSSRSAAAAAAVKQQGQTSSPPFTMTVLTAAYQEVLRERKRQQ